MNEVYKAISREIRDGKFLKALATSTTDTEKSMAIFKQQDELYKKIQFKKEFLKARSKQK